MAELASMLDRSLLKLKSVNFSIATQAEVRSIGFEIMTLRSNAISAGLINPAGPKAPIINSTLAKYAEIPTSISGYIQPPLPTDTNQLAKDNELFGPIITYVGMALTDFCNNVIYNIIEDNIKFTDKVKIDGIRRLLLTYINFLNNVPSKFLFPGSILDPNFREISLRLSNVLSQRLGVMILPPGSMTWPNLGGLCGAIGSSPDPAVRRTPSGVMIEIAHAIRLPVLAIIAAKDFNKYNNEANINALKSIPDLLQNFVTLSRDPVCAAYLTNFSTSIIPIPEVTRTLFVNLNASNFSASLSQLNTGIMNYLSVLVLAQIPHWLCTFISWIGIRIVGRSFSNPDQLNQLVAKTVLVLKGYFDILNVIINIFQVSIQNDPAGLRIAEHINNVTTKNGFKVNLVPVVRGGKMYKRKRSRKQAQRRRRRVVHSKRLSRRSR